MNSHYNKAVIAVVLAALAAFIPEVSEATTLEELVKAVVVAVGVFVVPNK